MTFSLRTRRLGLVTSAVLLAGVTLSAAGCTDNTTTTGPNFSRGYNQVQRLGNPLVSEVLLSKRSHTTHGTIGPDQDLALLAPEALSFLTGPGSVAGRSQGYANTLGGALLPDMLIVQTDKDPTAASGAGWLTWLPLAPFTNGYGGRKLDDDVVDLALLAVFGDPFGADPTHQTPELTTDNVPCGNCANGPEPTKFTTTFPYLAAPNP